MGETAPMRPQAFPAHACWHREATTAVEQCSEATVVAKLAQRQKPSESQVLNVAATVGATVETAVK